MADVDVDDAISALLRQDFGFFLRMAFAELGGNNDYEHNWHIDAIIHQLDRVRSGDNRRLIITIPPRHLKTRIVIAWCAWMLGHNPALSFLCLSYGQQLAEDHAYDCLRLIQSPWYGRAFPRLKLTSRALAHFRTSMGGGRMSSSIKGATTGFGADIIIVDDPLKAQDALSPLARGEVNDWFDGTLVQRPNSQHKGAIIVIMQRLHAADLVGALKQRGDFEELCLPAIAVKDEVIPLTRGRTYRRRAGCALHPARQSLAFLEQRKAQSPYVFAGQFQQDPIPEIGSIIEAKWLLRYDRAALDLTEGQIVMSLDTASKDNLYHDYSAFVIARYYRKQLHIIDVFRARLKFPELMAKTVELARLHNVDVLLIEDASSGQQLIPQLCADVPDGVPLPTPCRPQGSKGERVNAASALIQAGRLFVPEQGHWVSDFLSELLGFPSAAHDDQIDALAQLLLWARDMDRYRIEPNVGPEEMWSDESGPQQESDFDDDDYGWGA